MLSTNMLSICQALPWTKTTVLNKTVAQETFIQLSPLFEQYGCAQVLAVLASLWRIERALAFWEKIEYPLPNCDMEHLVVASSYSKGYNGGIERAQAQLMTIWSKMGHTVVFFSEETPSEKDYKYPVEVERVIIPNSKKLKERLLQIEKNIKEKQICVFINHSWWEETAVWECVLCRLLGVAYVTYCHGLFSAIYKGGYEFGYLSFKAFRLNNLILSLSAISARYYQMCGCRSFLLHNPIPEELQDVHTRARLNNHKILWLGRIAPEKRPVDAVRILAAVKRTIPDVILEFAGQAEKESYNEVLRTAQELNVSDRIEWRGYLQNVSEAFLDCGLMLFTSPEEGYPMTLIESKAYGVPCIMYSLPYLSLIQDGKGIATADVGDINTMADHVVELFQNDKFRQQMGEAARESFNALQQYDIFKTWNEVFRLALLRGNSECPSFFDPCSLLETENNMLPILLDEVFAGRDKIREDNVDYRIGHGILKYPRMIMKIYRKLLNHHGKV